MKGRIRIKRCLSLLLAVVLLMGSVNGLSYVAVSAASDATDFVLTFKSRGISNGNPYWTFEIPNGVSAEHLERYQFQAYINNSNAPQSVWMEFRTANNLDDIIIYNGCFTTQIKNTNSIRIPAETEFHELKSGSTTELKDGGKIFRLKETFLMTQVDGVCQQMEEPVEFTLSFNQITASNAGIVKPSGLPEGYKAGNPASGCNYCFESYIDGSDTPQQTIIQFMNGGYWNGYMIIWSRQWPGTKVVPTSSFCIPAGTVFYEYETGVNAHKVENGKQMILTETFRIVKENGNWIQTNDQISLEFQNENTYFQFSHSSLLSYYQQITNAGAQKQGVFYKYTGYRDGSDILEMGILEIRPAQGDVIIWNGWFPGLTGTPANSLYIPKGTILTPYNPNTQTEVTKDGKQLVLSEAVMVVKDSGVWVSVSEMEEFTLSYTDTKVNGEVFTWDFTHSALPETYVAGEKYRFEAEVDGGAQTIWMELGADGVMMISTDAFSQGKVPKESLCIPENTILLQYDAETGALIQDGKSLKLIKEIKVIWKDDEWMLKERDAVFHLSQVTEDKIVLLTDETELAGSGTWKLSSVKADDVKTEDVKITFPAQTEGKSFTEAVLTATDFLNGLPQSSLYIMAGTKLEHVETHEIYTVREQLYITWNEEKWEEKNLQVSLAFNVAPESGNWSFIFDNMDMWRTGFYAISEIVLDGQSYEGVRFEFPTWTSANPATYTANMCWIYKQCFPKQTPPVESFYIPTGATLTSEKNGLVYEICEQLSVTKTEAGWEQDKYETGLTFTGMEGEDFLYAFDNTDLKDTGLYEISSVLVDDEAVTGVRMRFTEQARVLSSSFPEGKAPTESFVIPTGARLENVKTGLVYTVKEEITVEKTGTGWVYVAPQFNDVQLTFMYYDNIKAFIFKAEIIAGPDKGKNIVDVYGDWAAPAPLGEVLYEADGQMKAEKATWYPCNTDMFYVAATSSSAWASKQTKIQIAQGTLIEPRMEGKSEVMIRIANEVNLEKDEAYGLWRLKDEVGTDLECTDVALTITLVKGDRVVFSVSAPDGTGVNLSETYGASSNFYGSVVLCKTLDEGEFTTEGVTFAMWGAGLSATGFSLTAMESMRIPGGTILYSRSNQCVKPLRVVNSVSLVRDEEDNWKYQSGVTTSGTTTPSTGNSTVSNTGSSNAQEEIVQEPVVTQSRVEKEANSVKVNTAKEKMNLTGIIILSVCMVILILATVFAAVFVMKKKALKK